MRRCGEFGRKTRIIVCDDNYDHASGIRELVNLENDFEVIANAANVNIAIALIKKYQPDIVLMDINMPDVDGITGISEIEKLKLGTKVIALTGYDDPDLIYRAMKLGAKGYILKTMVSAQLIHAIDEVAQGKVYLPNALVSKFFEHFQNIEKRPAAYVSNDNEENLLSYLTNREEEVLELLTNGVNYKGIAAKLFLSETTVKTHVNNIFQKLQVNDRTQAVLYAINKGFVRRHAA